MIATGSSPTWAPDGSLIAFVAPDETIHTVNVSGADDTFLSSPAVGHLWGLDWQPR
jgi:hypothetical protein